MKALAIDAASSSLVVAARNGANTVTLSLDIGTRQSEKLLPAIDYVLSQVELSASELDYTVLCKGPGTFTGLRLAFSALKAIELAHNVPIYGIDSLTAFAFPYKSFPNKIVSVIDAKKDQFFAAVYQGERTLLEAQDTTIETVLSLLEAHETIITTGPDAAVFAAALKAKNSTLTITYVESPLAATDALFMLAEEAVEKEMPPLQDYEGPAYLRKSEAELSLEARSSL